ncbi:MAG TPA: hypothetical protein VFG69_16040 [Nannocystaceae bacterium]|nr:hypothetical protein [Nannocystaceae bacterium]
MLSIASTLFAANLSLLTAPLQPTAQPAPTLKPGVHVPTPIQSCSTIAADKSSTLTANDMEDVLTSTGTSYASRTACNRFVADFIVLSSASPGTQFSDGWFKVGGGLMGQETASTCEGARVDMRVYKKALGASSFASYSNIVLEGDWHDSPTGFDSCSWKVVSGAVGAAAEPNNGGTETYRVAVKASIGGVAKPVEARIRFNDVPH